MTRFPVVELDGVHVALADCDWVLRGSCGCPVGVAMAQYDPTEEEAWLGFCETPEAVAAAQRAGQRIELMTHDRYRREVSARMTVRCEHSPGQQVLPEVTAT